MWPSICKLSVLAFLLVSCCNIRPAIAQVDDFLEGGDSGERSNDTTTTTEESPEARRAQGGGVNRPRDLCKDVLGCKCEGVRLLCDCRTTSLGHNPLKFAGVTIANTKAVEYITISNCEYVDLDNNRLFSTLTIKEMSISSVVALRILPNTLTKMGSLTLQNISSLTADEGAFDRLEADKVVFKNVNFSSEFESDKTMKPNLIRTSFEFDGCSLPEGMNIDLDDPSSRMDLFILRGCRLQHLEAVKANVVKFEMSGNHLAEFPDRHSIQLRYSELEIANNNYKGVQLPDMRSTTSGSVDVIINLKTGQNAPKTFRTWVDSFKMTSDRETTTAGRSSAPCTEGKPSAKHLRVLHCPTIGSMEKYVQEDKLATLPFEAAAPSSSGFQTSILLGPMILSLLAVLLLSA